MYGNKFRFSILSTSETSVSESYQNSLTFEVLKTTATTPRKVWFVTGSCFFDFVGTIFWAFSLKYDLLSRAVSIFTVLNFIVVILVGILVFKEDLSFINKIGIGLGVVSVVLMEI